jgi:predicted secreted protein
VAPVSPRLQRQVIKTTYENESLKKYFFKVSSTHQWQRI